VESYIDERLNMHEQVVLQARFQNYISNEQSIVSGMAKAAGHMTEVFEDYVQSSDPQIAGQGDDQTDSPASTRAHEDTNKLKQLRAEVGKLVTASNHLASKFSDYTTALTEQASPTVVAFGSGMSPGPTQHNKNRQGSRRRKTPLSARARPKSPARALFSAVRPATASKIRPGPASVARRAKWTRENFKNKAQFDFVISKLVSILLPTLLLLLISTMVFMRY
jgi:hypothetical protein